MKVIVVSGPVASGKTTLAKRIAKEKGYKYLDVKEVIRKNKVALGYDRKMRSKIIDLSKLNKVLVKIIRNSKQSLIIDSHLSHHLPKKYVDLCIITKCSLKALKKRLQKRKYSRDKVRVNLDAEIFDVCLVEAKELGHKIKVVDMTNAAGMHDFLVKK